MLSILDHALNYFNKGYPVLPLRGKVPAIRGVELATYQSSKTTEQDVARWFEHGHSYNIGLFPPRDVIIADVDQPRKLTQTFPENTPTARSGERGYHVYLSSAGVDLPDKQAFKVAWGDVKQGGFVCVPPSVHPDTGIPYVWFPGRSLLDLDLAPVPGWLVDLLRLEHLPDLAVASHNPQKNINTSLGVMGDKWPCSQLAKDPQTAVRIVQNCGGKVAKLGKGFKCVLPGHSEDNPSAALWQPDGGYIGYHDFHARSGFEWLTLGEVWYARCSGEVRKLTGAEQIVWWLRALHDCGLISISLVKHHPIPQDAKFAGTSYQNVKAVYSGLVLLLSLRKLYDAAQVSTTYSFTFAKTWCGLDCTIQTIGRAVKWLFKQGFVYRHGQTEAKNRFGQHTGLLALGKPKGGD